MSDSGKPASILVVDDTPANSEVLVEMLSKEGFDVRVAQDGERALEEAQHSAPSLVLLDVLMPGLDGFETCRRLRSIPSLRQLPVIFMTALSDAHDKVRAFEAGADDYVIKPFERGEVLARVRMHLTRRELERKLEQATALAAAGGDEPDSDVPTLQAIERAHFITVLRRTHGVIEGPRGAAKLLDLKPSTARFRMKKLGISRTDYLSG
jgi:DNA-binding response OmpR family regulator